MSAPVLSNGKLSGPIIIGDSYQNENARAFTWLITPVSGVSVGTVTCKFGAIAGSCADKQFIVDGTVEAAVSYTHLTLPTIHVECRSRWSPYH